MELSASSDDMDEQESPESSESDGGSFLTQKPCTFTRTRSSSSADVSDMSDHDTRQGDASAARQEQGDGPAAMRGQGDAPAPMRGGDMPEVGDDIPEVAGLGRFRRDGVPCAAMINRKGDLWTLATRQESTEPWERLFILRNRRLRGLGLQPESVMPEDARKDTWNELVEWWEHTSFGARRRKEIAATYWTNDEISRNWRSAIKAAMFTLFGGQVWVRLAIALGPVDGDMVRILNDIISEKIRDKETREPQMTPVRGARQRPRELDPDAPRGVQHKVSEAKRARADAKWWAKRLASETRRWKKGRSKMSWDDWNEMQREAEDLTLNHVRCHCRSCHALAMLLPCSCHVISMLLPCSCFPAYFFVSVNII